MRHELTDELRTSDNLAVVGLRRCLREKGIDPETSALAEWFDDDEYKVYGVVVTANGRVFELDYDYEEAPTLADGRLVTWREMPRTWSHLANRSEIIAAVRYLDLNIDP